MLRELKNKGFASLVEVIVTAIVFIIAASGILATTTMFRPQGQASSQKMEAAYIGKGLIDDLRQKVSAEDWWDPNGNLAVGTYTTTIGGYDVTYIITEPIPDVRHLTMNISWPDP